MTKIIAEFCQNHNGDFEILKKMIEKAASAGASYGKMQTIFTNNLSFRPQFEAGLIINDKIYSIKRPYKNEYDRLKKLEINQKQMANFVNICKEHDLIPLTTCFARSNAKMIKDVGFKEIKVASYDCSSFTMIRELKELFENLIISTGATFDSEIELTSKILENYNYSLLHCVTIYPTPMERLNLARMNFLRKFTKTVGFSDHSLVSRDKLIASKIAIMLGADVIERHFTILPEDETRDGPVSINPHQLKELSDFSKMSKNDQKESVEIEFPKWKKTIGIEKRDLSDEEMLNRDYYKGRFASPRKQSNNGSIMIYNWEEISIDE